MFFHPLALHFKHQIQDLRQLAEHKIAQAIAEYRAYDRPRREKLHQTLLRASSAALTIGTRRHAG